MPKYSSSQGPAGVSYWLKVQTEKKVIMGQEVWKVLTSSGA